MVDEVHPLVRRSLVAVGFLFGLGLLALVTAGSAHAAEDSRSPGLLGGVLGGVVEPLSPVTAGVSEVVGAVEPVTAPLLEPVTGTVLEPVLEPVLEVLAPVTDPLLGPVEPVVTPVARAIGVEPSALGIQERTAAPAPVETGVGDFAPTPVSAQPQPGDPVAVATASPLRTEVQTPPVTVAVVEPVLTSGSNELRAPVNGPVAPVQGTMVLSGVASPTASSGGGGSVGQVDLPGSQGFGSPDGGRVALSEHTTARPWCYVFGRHHPS
ncbi:hypothetical protein [Saccharothrix sp. HUAS TT1]|uniref:hypothetical protein n=1 Tax=unclassified Saccharothrix TaxID=2593673 RepID=UPI00345BA898